MKVGYVGLGAMGRALAGHLVKDHELIVWDLNPVAIDDFVARGAQAASSLADMGARCDVVILCLPKSANVHQALFGAGGLAENLAPGSVVVDQTSGVPGDTKVFAAALAERDIALIDAPVAGGVPSAIAGQITIMASGADAAFDRVRPVLESISPKVYRCSAQVGDGQAVKAINNMINAGYRMATLEMIAVGRKLGLDAASMTDALNSGTGRSFITYRLLPAVVEERSSTDFALTLMVKDLNQAADLGIATGAPMPISDAARGMMNMALNLLGDDARLDDIVAFVETLTKTKLAGAALPLDGTDDISTADALAMVTTAVALSNRVIMLENAGLASRAGLSAADFAPVITNGSATSREAELLFAKPLGLDDADDRTLATSLAALTRLVKIGAAKGVPMVMANQVRAQCLACADDIGLDAPLSAMTDYFIGRTWLA